MAKSSFDSSRFFTTACNFEGSLILVAALLGWFADINPFADLYFSEQALFYGIVGTVPLFIFFFALEQINIPSIRKIRSLLVDTLGSGLKTCHWTDIFFLAAIAGFSEELLFRGLIQPWIEASWGMAAGLIGSNIIFGLVHAVTPLYALLATLIGIYLGLSMDFGGERNLMTPMIIHGLYDFLAFLMIMKSFRRGGE
ncbi:lysostaphin resistance A-like protein [Methylotuvimicrobium sp. KM1]|uniref:CPBP family intramembrane glutamic endopeptidase n=1 Tax=Methylotuvimicrobium sp. KM1 TaxID=3377707 RepID=UPI00384A6AD8